MRSCLLLALATVLVAVEPKPAFELAVADGPVLVQHWDASPLGIVWADPGFAPLRARILAALGELRDESGIDVAAALPAMRGLRVRVVQREDPVRDHRLLWQVQADLGAQAAALAARVREQGREAAAAGADEAYELADGVAFARFGTVLVLGPSWHALAPLPAGEPAAHDWSLTIDGQAIGALVTAMARPGDDTPARVVAALAPVLATMRLDTDLVADGLASRIAIDRPIGGLAPVDLARCARLPAEMVAVSAIGVDGAALWERTVLPVLDAIAIGEGQTREQLLREADRGLARLGVDGGLQALLQPIAGTILFGRTRAAPLPGFVLVVPRSAGLDALLVAGVRALGAEPPADGQTAFVQLAQLPGSLVKMADHWVVTTDPTLAATWTDGTGGWERSPLAPLLQQAAAGACLCAVSDTAAELQELMGMGGMLLASAPLTQEEKQAALTGLRRLIALVRPSVQTLRLEAGGLVGEGRGLSPSNQSAVAVTAIIAAIAIPNLLESRVSSNEAAAAAALKSGILPAQVQFQAGAYVDTDQNGIGDFADSLALMAGRPLPTANGLTLMLLSPAFNADVPEVSGYRFRTYAATELGFVAYAWPVDEDGGRRVFALTQAGQVFAAPLGTPLVEPDEFALWGGREAAGRGYSGKPVWQPYHRAPARAAGGARPARRAAEPLDNEAATAAALKSGVHPAQIVFQSGGYVDADQNGIGDYSADFPSLAGTPVGEARLALSLLPETWNVQQPELNGYRYAMWADGERNFVAYAWPAAPANGQRMFAITAAGQVHAAPAVVRDGATVAPGREALWGDRAGALLSDPPAAPWAPYRR